MSRTLVIGAGISGLAAATLLQDTLPGGALQVWEAHEEAGGNVRSLRLDGRVLDRAANGWLDNEPAMTRLLQRAGLDGDVLKASDRFTTRWILADGRMQPAPLGPGPLLRTELLTAAEKARLLLEPVMPRGASSQPDAPGAQPDESVASFVRRRLGQGFVDRMVGPMAAGIFAAPPEDLSLRGAFPKMFELEREHRSLFLAMLARRGKGGAPSGHLETLPGGAGTLTDVLAERLGDALVCGRRVSEVQPVDGGYRVIAADASGAVVEDTFEHVVFACPGHVQAILLQRLAPRGAQALDGIPYAPVAVVCTAWEPGSWSREPEGFGVLMAKGEADAMGAPGVLGTVFTSSVFPGQARPNEHLLRTIIGGAIAPAAARDTDAQQLEARTRRALAVALGPERKPPVLVHVFRHRHGIPHYRVGHRDRVATVRQVEHDHPGLFFVGNHLDGPGVKDCARAAEALLERMGLSVPAVA